MKWRDRLQLSILLGLAVFPVVMTQAVVAVMDGPNEKLYGFPLFWIKAGVNWLSFVIDVPAMAIDVVVYVLMALLALTWAARTWSHRIILRAIKLLLWIVGVEVLVYCAMMFPLDMYRGGVTFDKSYEWADIKGYSLYVGMPWGR